MNELCESKVPFFFICDFLCEKTEIVLLDQLEKENIFCANPLFTNASQQRGTDKKLKWEEHPIPFDNYAQ